MKIFRWSGLIGFVVFTTLVTVIGFFFLDGWVKRGLEAAGFATNRAEVNIGNVDLTLNPLGFRIENVQIADADKPTHNAIELGDIELAINFPQLFLGNIRINNAEIVDIQTDTERSRVARLPDNPSAASVGAQRATEAAQDKAREIGSMLPSPSEAVDAQTQNTQAAVANAQQTLATSRTNMNNAIGNLPGDERLASYRQRIAEVKSINLDSLDNINRSQQLLVGISRDIATDKLAIEAVKSNLNRAVADGKNSVDAILNAPAKDLAQLRADYPLNAESAMKVAELLLGQAFFDRIEKAQYWYTKAKPWLDRVRPSGEPEEARPVRLDGEFVRFPHPDPTAAFQLDRSLVSFTADGWPWQLRMNDISSVQNDDTRPVTLALIRGEVSNAAMRVDGVLDQINGDQIDTYSFSGRGIGFKSTELNLAGTTIDWVPQPANLSGNIVATNGALSGKVTLAFPSNEFDATGGGQTGRFISSALQTIDDFTVDVLVSGRVTSPRFSVQSNIDNKLSSALRDVARAEYDAWVASVREELNQKVAELRQPVDRAYADITALRADAEDRIQQFEAEVVAEVRSLEEKAEQERKRIEDRARAEARAAEEAARKAAEDKLKEEAGNIRDRFSF